MKTLVIAIDGGCAGSDGCICLVYCVVESMMAPSEDARPLLPIEIRSAKTDVSRDAECSPDLTGESLLLVYSSKYCTLCTEVMNGLRCCDSEAELF